jgi:hypothetical protein
MLLQFVGGTGSSAVRGGFHLQASTRRTDMYEVLPKSSEVRLP